MPVRKSLKRGKKTRKSRRVRAGAPTEFSIERSNAELDKLLNTSIFENIDYSIVRRLSPYATFDNRYLLEIVARTLINYIADENILLDVINRTIALKDPRLLNDNNVDDIINSLISYGSKFNQSMVLILKSMPPIRNEYTLDTLYELAIYSKNPTVLEALRDAGHVPLTSDQYEFFAATLSNNYKLTNDHETRERVKHLISIFNTIKPAAVTETSNFIYSLGKHYADKSLRSNSTAKEPSFPNVTPENIEDIHSHLKAIANNESI